MSIDQTTSAAQIGDVSTDFVNYRRPGGRIGRRRLSLRGAVLLGVCLIGGAILARNGGRPPVATTAPLAHPGFVVTERLAPMVSFNPPETSRGPLHYQARLRESSLERWDTLTFGDLGSDEVFFRVTLRLAKSPVPRASLFVEMAKQSAEVGAAVVHATNPEFYTSERGPVEWAEVTLSAPDGQRLCVGFRLDRARDVDLSGLACGAGNAMLDQAALGRLIDRLSATGSGMEGGLGQVLKGGAT